MSASGEARPFDKVEPRFDPLERVSLWLSSFSMIGMMALMLLEVVLRGLFNSTTEHSDELVGYLLVGVSFLSLAVCQSRGAFHRVEMVQMRLGPRGKAVSSLIFAVLSFGYVALTDWYFLQFVISNYNRDNVAPTPLATPLWIPETAMVVGATLLLIALGRSIAIDIKALRS